MLTNRKIIQGEKLENTLKYWRENNYTVVFTNGCFDILHPGHIDYLEKARNMGDKLIVGVNTDDSVRRIKGEARPVTNQDARTKMLAALEFVDAVVLFNEDTPFNLIIKVMPDILVKGSDYETGNIIGGDIVRKNGGKVATIDLVEGYSTTSLIEKIKKL